MNLTNLKLWPQAVIEKEIRQVGIIDGNPIWLVARIYGDPLVPVGNDPKTGVSTSLYELHELYGQSFPHLTEEL